MDPTSPQYEALEWMVENNGISMEIIEDGDGDDEEWESIIAPRYVFAVLYYATTGIAWAEKELFLTPGFPVCSWMDGTSQFSSSLQITCDSSRSIVSIELCT